jgi:hypothetical protein
MIPVSNLIGHSLFFLGWGKTYVSDSMYIATISYYTFMVFYYLTGCDPECFYADPLLVSSFLFAVLLKKLYATNKNNIQNILPSFIEPSKKWKYS